MGIPIPCPTKIPSAMTYFGRLAYAEPPYSWRGWGFGSTTMGFGARFEHLVWMASPRPVRSYAKLVSGPSQGAVTRVLPLARVTINGWRLRAVYVPAASVAFGSHVVLIWTVARHTYGIGFHDHEAFACLCSSTEGRRQTLALDTEFVRYTELVSP